jgi:hypothetical protein
MKRNKQELQIVVNSKYGATISQYGVTKLYAESLIIAQINSQCKLDTLRRQNRKILIQKRNLKGFKAGVATNFDIATSYLFLLSRSSSYLKI